MHSLYLLVSRFAQYTACDPTDKNCKSDTGLPKVTANGDTLKLILQYFFGVIAAVAVIFIIINALRYSTSLGDPQANAKIRNSLIFAAVGLVVIMSAELIVTLLLGRL